MDSSLSCLSMMLLFGGLLLLIMVQINNSKLGKILNNLRLMNELLKKMAGEDKVGRLGEPSLPEKPPPPPVPPKSAADFFESKPAGDAPALQPKDVYELD